MPLQEWHLGVDGGLLDVERGQGCGLAWLNGGDAVDGGAAVDADGVTPDATQVRQCGLWRQVAAGELQALAHHAVQDQRHEADARVRLDALGQAVEDRGNVDLRLQHLEAAPDVGQRLVAVHHLDRGHLPDIGDQHELAVHELGAGQRGLVDLVGEQVSLQVDLDDARQMGVAHLMEEACLGAGIRELAATLDLAFVLGGELAGQLPCSLLQGMDTQPCVVGMRRVDVSGQCQAIFEANRSSSSC